jgi:transglutaminase-like putative cysteine protease
VRRRKAATTPAGWRPSVSAASPAATAAQFAWLLLAVATCTAPHLATVTPWVAGVLLLAIAWRGGAVLGRWPLPGRWLRGLLTFASTFAVASQYRGLTGLDAGSALLLLMLALKLLETTTARDRTVVVLIAWFALFAAFLREQSLLSVAQLGAGVMAGALALLQGARSGTTLPATAGLRASGRLLLHAAPLAVALFVLFPRLPGPIWALPAAGGAGRTGLSDEMSPGDITSLARSDQVAFRVRFSRGTPVPGDLYWRGPVLERFDGRRWRGAGSASAAPVAPARPAPGATFYDYEVILEPHSGPWLLPLETLFDWDVTDASLSTAQELINRGPVDRRMAYRARSAAAGSFQATTPPAALLSTARQRNPEAQALAAELRATAATDREYLLAILQRFRTEEFFYTLAPPALGADPIDDFLFRTRAGFCEHYAAAFTLLARAGGLPARVVTGYQGGEWNPVGGYWVIRQSDAHAWSEVWLDGRWVRFDPTGAVAPERIEAGLEAALPGMSGDGLPIVGGQRLLDAVALRWDALNATWDRFVLAFGPEQQTDLLLRLGLRAPTPRDIALACALATSVVLLTFTIARLGRPRPARDPLGDAWHEVARKLARVTRPQAAHETPAEYAEAVVALRPDLATTVGGLVNRYLELRYDAPASASAIGTFRRAVRRFRPR